MPFKDKEKQRAAVRESQRRRRAAAGKPKRRKVKLVKLEMPEPGAVRWGDARSLLELMSGQIDAVLSADGLEVPDRARLAGYLAGVVCRIIETLGVEQRLDEIEKTLSELQEGKNAEQSQAG